MNTENEPQGFGFVTPPSWWSIVFNYKTISIVAILALSASVYILDLQKDKLQLELDKSIIIYNSLVSENRKCNENYKTLSKVVTDAADATLSFNIEMQDLKSKLEKYNKINSNNSNIIGQLTEDKFAQTCEAGIAELVDAF